MAVVVDVVMPVKQYLELAVSGELSDFEAEMGKYLLNITAGPDVYEGRSPLHLAALHGRQEVVELIMASPAISSDAVNARDRFGFTPLHLAVRSKHEDVVRILITSPLTNPNLAAFSEKDEEGRDCEGFTPLHLAAEANNIAIVKQLLLLQPEQGRPAVNIQVATWQGKTALDIARESDHGKLEGILESRDPNWLLQERQKSANSANAILVGAALVATVTFGCLSQPPTALSADGVHTVGFAFQVFAALSFTFSIVTLVFATAASISAGARSLKSEVFVLRSFVIVASGFLNLAIVLLCVAALQIFRVNSGQPWQPMLYVEAFFLSFLILLPTTAALFIRGVLNQRLK